MVADNTFDGGLVRSLYSLQKEKYFYIWCYSICYISCYSVSVVLMCGNCLCGASVMFAENTFDGGLAILLYALQRGKKIGIPCNLR
jgi:hypothetical protein